MAEGAGREGSEQGTDAGKASTPQPEATATDAPEPTATPEPETITGRYVAMGSSYAAGQGAGADVAGGSCVQGAESYPYLVAEAFGLDLVDVSCNGAKIDNVVDTPQGEAVPQLEAVTADTSIVTITVGGNDVGYVLNFFRCMNNGCPEGVVDDEAARTERFADLTAELTDMLGVVAERAPQARVLLVAYPVVVESAEGTCEGVQEADVEFQYDMGARLQQAFVDAADAADAEFVDAYTNSFGHGACVPIENRWMDGATATTAAFSWHPNALGQRAMADLVVAHLTAA